MYYIVERSDYIERILLEIFQDILGPGWKLLIDSFYLANMEFFGRSDEYCGWLDLLKCSAIGIGFNGAKTNCGIAHILDILLMNSCNTDIFFSNYYHLQSVRFELRPTDAIMSSQWLELERFSRYGFGGSR